MGLLLLLKPGDVVEVGGLDGPPVRITLMEKSGRRSRVEVSADKTQPVKVIRTLEQLH